MKTSTRFLALVMLLLVVASGMEKVGALDIPDPGVVCQSVPSGGCNPQTCQGICSQRSLKSAGCFVDTGFCCCNNPGVHCEAIPPGGCNPQSCQGICSQQSLKFGSCVTPGVCCCNKAAST